MEQENEVVINEAGVPSDRKVIGNGYLVLSIGQIRELLNVAKEDSKNRYGKVTRKSTIAIHSRLIKFNDDVDIQFSSNFTEIN